MQNKNEYFDYIPSNNIVLGHIESSGTSLIDYIYLPYNVLKNCLGEPNPDLNDGYKVDAEWVVVDKDNDVVATVYNYKDGKNYLGSEGKDINEITEWHIGGFDSRAVTLVNYIIDNRLKVK